MLHGEFYTITGVTKDGIEIPLEDVLYKEFDVGERYTWCLYYTQIDDFIDLVGDAPVREMQMIPGAQADDEDFFPMEYVDDSVYRFSYIKIEE